MYIRQSKQKHPLNGETYCTYRLVESFRSANGKVKQQTLLNLGRQFSVPHEQWKALTFRIEELARGQGALFEIDADIEAHAQQIFKKLTKNNPINSL